MRLIDADALIKDVGQQLDFLYSLEIDELMEYGRIIHNGMIQELKRMPTIDAEPVVRCKDCKHVIPYESGGFNCLTCPNVDRDVDENWYCADGEREEE